MSDIATKLTYLNETKSQLKDMINYGLPTENQITNETTFRNYVSSIFEAFLESLRDSTTLYTNLPKISGNGTQITLNDTANAPVRITLKASELSQDATPTPDSPQDIHTISGDNNVVVGNKNLWGGFSYSTTSNGIQFTYYKDGSVIANGTATGTATSMSASVAQSNNYLVTLEAGTYTLSGAFDGDKLLRICKKDGTTIKNSSSTTGDSFTLTEKTEAYIIVRIAQGQVCNNLKFYIQLEKGTATTYSPYTSNTQIISLGNIEYCKIGDYEDEFIYNTTDTSLELNQWYLKKNIGKVVLDGSESWGTYSSSSSRNVYSAPVLTNSDNYSNSSTIPNILLDRFNVVTQNASWVIGNASRRTQAQNYLYLTYEPNTTETDFKTWLSTHNTTLYYVLGIPTYTQITGTLETQLENIYKNMLSYKGTTNVSQINNDLPFVLGVSALKDLE